MTAPDAQQLDAVYEVLWGREDVDPLVGTRWRSRDYYLVPHGPVLTVAAVVRRGQEVASVVMDDGSPWGVPNDGRDHERAQRVLAKFTCREDCNADMIRAAGDVQCKACGLPYRKHPRCRGHYDRSGEYYWLRVLCDGLHVKL